MSERLCIHCELPNPKDAFNCHSCTKAHIALQDIQEERPDEGLIILVNAPMKQAVLYSQTNDEEVATVTHGVLGVYEELLT